MVGMRPLSKATSISGEIGLVDISLFLATGSSGDSTMKHSSSSSTTLFFLFSLLNFILKEALGLGALTRGILNMGMASFSMGVEYLGRVSDSSASSFFIPLEGWFLPRFFQSSNNFSNMGVGFPFIPGILMSSVDVLDSCPAASSFTTLTANF